VNRACCGVALRPRNGNARTNTAARGGEAPADNSFCVFFHWSDENLHTLSHGTAIVLHQSCRSRPAWTSRTVFCSTCSFLSVHQSVYLLTVFFSCQDRSRPRTLIGAPHTNIILPKSQRHHDFNKRSREFHRCRPDGLVAVGHGTVAVVQRIAQEPVVQGEFVT